MGSRGSPEKSSIENPASPAATAPRAVSATPSGLSAKPFSRSAETGSSVADTISAACAERLLFGHRPVEPPERRRKAAAGGGQRLEAQRCQQPGRSRIPRIGDQQRVAGAVKRPESISAICFDGHAADTLRLDGRFGQMSTQPQAFSLGREGGEDGSFQRQASTFRNYVTDDGSSELPAGVRPLSPVRRPGLPVGAPHADRPAR